MAHVRQSSSDLAVAVQARNLEAVLHRAAHRRDHAERHRLRLRRLHRLEQGQHLPRSTSLVMTGPAWPRTETPC